MCAGLRTCSTSQYVSQNHTATSDRVCAAQAAACTDSQVEAASAGPYQLRICSAVYRSCSDIWRKNPASARANNGYYVVSAETVHACLPATPPPATPPRAPHRHPHRHPPPAPPPAPAHRRSVPGRRSIICTPIPYFQLAPSYPIPTCFGPTLAPLGHPCLFPSPLPPSTLAASNTTQVTNYPKIELLGGRWSNRNCGDGGAATFFLFGSFAGPWPSLCFRVDFFAICRFVLAIQCCDASGLFPLFLFPR